MNGELISSELNRRRSPAQGFVDGGPPTSSQDDRETLDDRIVPVPESVHDDDYSREDSGGNEEPQNPRRDPSDMLRHLLRRAFPRTAHDRPHCEVGREALELMGRASSGKHQVARAEGETILVDDEEPGTIENDIYLITLLGLGLVGFMRGIDARSHGPLAHDFGVALVAGAQ